VAEEDIVDAEAGFVPREAEAPGGVGLGVAVDEEGLEAFQGDGGGEVDGGGGFADPALLVDDGDDLRRGGGGLWFVDWVDGDHLRKEKGIGRSVWWQCVRGCAEVRGAVENLWKASFAEQICGF